ncbi:MAG: NapC/NirT family cytochrome c [Polyangiaceae bacterium]
MAHSSPLTALTLVCALIAGSICLHYLWKRPPLVLATKLRLLLGLGVFPTLTAVTSTVTGMEATTHREFCGSCHVMGAHYANAVDPNAQSLAARHSRNPFFGDRSCYVCHADYGMYGYAMTKAGGMRHVYEYYLGGYKDMTLEEAEKKIHLRKPYDNTNCRQCHTTTASVWRSVPDHISLSAELASNRVSCTSAGCHGYAHPFSKAAQGASSAAPGVTPGSSSAGTAGSAPPASSGGAP